MKLPRSYRLWNAYCQLARQHMKACRPEGGGVKDPAMEKRLDRLSDLHHRLAQHETRQALRASCQQADVEAKAAEAARSGA